MFRVVVAGSRTFADYTRLESVLDKVLANHTDNVCIVSGTANGADRLGELYAFHHGYHIEQYPADWNRFGRSAGYKRNVQMAEVADACVCFHQNNSRGTAHMIQICQERDIPLRIIKC